MASDVVFDTIVGATLEATQANARQVRTGVVRDVDVVGSADAAVLNKAMDAILERVPWQTPHPSNNGTRFTRMFMRPDGLRSDRVRFEMLYEAGGAGIASAFMVRDGSQMMSYRTRFLPGSNRHVRLLPNEFTDPDSGRKVAPNSIEMELLRPVRTITVTGLVYGRPPENMREGVGKVNAAPFEGKPVGYWMVTSMESDASRYQGYYSFTGSIATKNNEDWSEIAVLQDPITGLPVKVVESEVSDILGEDYAYGVMPGNGFCRVCPFETVSFPTLFAFGELTEGANGPMISFPGPSGNLVWKN